MSCPILFLVPKPLNMQHCLEQKRVSRLSLLRFMAASFSQDVSCCCFTIGGEIALHQKMSCICWLSFPLAYEAVFAKRLRPILRVKMNLIRWFESFGKLLIMRREVSELVECWHFSRSTSIECVLENVACAVLWHRVFDVYYVMYVTAVLCLGQCRMPCLVRSRK